MDKKNIIFYSAALAVVFLDQLIKFLVRQNIQLGQSIPIIKNVFHLTYVANTGSAFGLFKSFSIIFFVLFSIIVIIGIFYYLKKIIKEDKKLELAVGLLLGGTIGNLIDRLAFGTVIDFLDFRIWPVFNIADSAVSVSIILLIFILWKK